MKQNAFNRAWLAIGTFWAGVHLMGLTMWQNGGAEPDNVGWVLFQSLWRFEISLIKWAALFALYFILLIVVLELMGWVFQGRSKAASVVHPEISVKPSPEPSPIQPPSAKQDANPAFRNTTARVPKPPPPPASAAELKRRAIKQITGKENWK